MNRDGMDRPCLKGRLIVSIVLPQYVMLVERVNDCLIRETTRTEWSILIGNLIRASSHAEWGVQKKWNTAVNGKKVVPL